MNGFRDIEIILLETGNTALIIAVMQNPFKTDIFLDLLKNKDIKLNKRNKNGKTALTIAKTKNINTAVGLLQKAGAK